MAAHNTEAQRYRLIEWQADQLDALCGHVLGADEQLGEAIDRLSEARTNPQLNDMALAHYEGEAQERLKGLREASVRLAKWVRAALANTDPVPDADVVAACSARTQDLMNESLFGAPARETEAA